MSRLHYVADIQKLIRLTCDKFLLFLHSTIVAAHILSQKTRYGFCLMPLELHDKKMHDRILHLFYVEPFNTHDTQNRTLSIWLVSSGYMSRGNCSPEMVLNTPCAKEVWNTHFRKVNSESRLKKYNFNFIFFFDSAVVIFRAVKFLVNLLSGFNIITVRDVEHVGYSCSTSGWNWNDYTARNSFYLIPNESRSIW